jgi:hypothetical protein
VPSSSFIITLRIDLDYPVKVASILRDLDYPVTEGLPTSVLALIWIFQVNDPELFALGVCEYGTRQF